MFLRILSGRGNNARRRRSAAILAGRLVAAGVFTVDTPAAVTGPVASFEVESCELIFVKGNLWECNLDASGSTGDIVAWNWEFCNGSTATGERPRFLPVPESGCDFTLTVTDSQDRTDSTTIFVDPTEHAGF
jgi:hypothetical protein